MARIVNPHTIRPYELQAGDVMIRTVTLHLQEIPGHGLCYRMYVCPFEGTTSEGVPQGARIYNDTEALARQLFSTVINAGGAPDVY